MEATRELRGAVGLANRTCPHVVAIRYPPADLEGHIEGLESKRAR